MSTKTPDGKPYDPDAWFKSKYREDVTEQYKYGESTRFASSSLLPNHFNPFKPTLIDWDSPSPF